MQELRAVAVSRPCLRRRWMQIGGLVSVAAAALVALAPASQAAPANVGIKVLGENAEVLRTFKSLRCRASLRDGLHALGRDRGWSLFITVPDPTFKLATRTYPLLRAPGDAEASFSVGPSGASAGRHSNVYNPVPSFPRMGGSIQFQPGQARPRRPAKVSLGFIQAWNGPTPTSDAVNLAGYAPCL